MGVVNFHLLSKHLKEQHILKTLKLALLNSKRVLFFRVRNTEIENMCASLMAKKAKRKKHKLNRARREYVFHTKATPYSKMDLHSRNGLQDPQHSSFFFAFYLPSTSKVCRRAREPYR